MSVSNITKTMRALRKYEIFRELSEVDQVFLSISILRKLLNGYDDVIIDNPECNAVILTFIALKTCNGFDRLEYGDKYNYLTNTYNELEAFRYAKCIENNFRTKESHAYINMMFRYIMNLGEYFVKHPDAHNALLLGDSTIKEMLEDIVYYVKEVVIEEKEYIGMCSACDSRTYRWCDLSVCSVCEMTTL